jgi:hypothetical protein
MGWAKPHAGGDFEPMYLEYNMFLTPPVVETLATMNVEIESKL